MTQQPVHPEPAETSLAGAPVPSPLAPGEKPSIWRVLKDQRKALWVARRPGRRAASGSSASSTAGPSAPASRSASLLGVVNHVATEFWLLRLITSGDQPTRNKMIAATLVRLGVLTVVAVASPSPSGPTVSGCCSVWPSTG